MQRTEQKESRLGDYQVLDYKIEHVDLEIDLTKDPVQVKSRLKVKPNPECKNLPNDLKLDGENMILKKISLDGKVLSDQDYDLTDRSLTIKNVPSNEFFTIESETTLGENKDLFGLYETEGIWLVKAESEGLRRVLFCKDRPDNLATYTTTIIANKKLPTLLANGQLIETKDLGNDVHSVKWHDKVPKASYLFAMVAGDLKRKESQFYTQSGRAIPIEFYLPEEALAECDYAMEILKKAMAWDEKTYHLQCDLPQYMVTGVNKYAAGASEPPGLNLFNTQFLLGVPATKTAANFLRIAEVISHEFFHYWSGDRVTIRDWFNLTLKEGLATFREQDFLESLFGSDLIRINQGKTLEKDSPRVDSYKAVRSLYTAAVYEKSAEIFRMLKTILGEETFYKGMHQYFKENDGKAVTIETLIASLEKFSNQNLGQFILWFTQPGIPQVDIKDVYDPNTRTYTLSVKQYGKDKDYQPLPIPITLGLLDKTGKEIYSSKTFIADQSEQTFCIKDVDSAPIPSLFRNFSAPVEYKYSYTNDDLLLLMRSDTNLFNRKVAASQYIKQWIIDYCDDKNPQLTADFFATYRSLIKDKTINSWVLAQILALPSDEDLIKTVDKSKFSKIYQAREIIESSLAKELMPEFKERIKELSVDGDDNRKETIAGFNLPLACKSQLKKTCMQYLSKVEPENIKPMAMEQLQKNLATDMTETCNALELLVQLGGPELKTGLDMFYHQWKHDNAAINTWFRLQASIPSIEAIETVRNLLKHPAFDISNPSKVYALARPFWSNPKAFHADSGEGYKLLADIIITLDKINPAIAARILLPFTELEKYDSEHQTLITNQLERILVEAQSTNVLDGVKKILGTSSPADKKDSNSVASQLMSWVKTNPKNPETSNNQVALKKSP